MQYKCRRMLILGGTSEGRKLATRAFQTFPRDVEIITSYAGRTKRNKIPPGTIREGGFGGVEGLKTFIKNESIDVLIDATHPFAKTISNHATIAARDAGCPHLILRRPNWVMPKIAQIINFSQMAEVANCSAIQGKRVFLSSGTQGLQSLAKLKNVWFLVRLITKPGEFLPLAHHKVIIDSPPFVEEQEIALLEEQILNEQTQREVHERKLEKRIEDLEAKLVADELKYKNKLKEAEEKLQKLKEFSDNKDELERNFEKLLETLETERKHYSELVDENERKSIRERDRFRKDCLVQFEEYKQKLQDEADDKLSSKTKKTLKTNKMIKTELTYQVSFFTT